MAIDMSPTRHIHTTNSSKGCLPLAHFHGEGKVNLLSKKGSTMGSKKRNRMMQVNTNTASGLVSCMVMLLD